VDHSDCGGVGKGEDMGSWVGRHVLNDIVRVGVGYSTGMGTVWCGYGVVWCEDRYVCMVNEVRVVLYRKGGSHKHYQKLSWKDWNV
jgi:hypothetical protein